MNQESVAKIGDKDPLDKACLLGKIELYNHNKSLACRKFPTILYLQELKNV